MRGTLCVGRRDLPNLRANAAETGWRGLSNPALWTLALALALLGAAPGLAQTPVLVYTTLTDSPDPVVAGEQLTISVTITNTATAPGVGNNHSTNTILRSTLTGLPVSYDSETFPGATCGVAASVLTCNLGTLNHGGGSITGTIVFDVSPSAADGSTIDLDFDLYGDQIAAPGVDGDTATDVETEAELTVASDGPAPTGAVPGQNLVYNLTISNAGPSDAAGVTLSVNAITGLGAATYSGACMGASCSIGTLSAGADADVTVTFVMADDFHLTQPATTSLAHTFTVASTTPEPSPPGNRTALFSTPVTPIADLAVTLTDGLTTVVAGAPITYTLTLTNNGPSRLDAVGVSSTSPPPVLSAIYSTSQGYFSSANLTDNWAGLNLATGQSATLTVAGTVAPALTGSPIVVTLAVAPRTGITDPTPASATDNNTALTRQGDLRITKSNGVDGVAPSQLVTYTIEVSNTGPSDITGATVADTFPPEISSVTWSCVPARPLTGIGQLLDGTGGVDGLDAAAAVAVAPNGAQVYVAAAGSDNSLSVFTRTAATGLLQFAQVAKQGAGGVDGMLGAASVAVSPDGLHVYVASPGSDAVAIFSRNTGTGLVTWQGMVQDGVGGVDGLDGARGVAVSPDGRSVYVASQVDGAVAVFSRNPATHVLTFVERLNNSSPGVSGLAGARAVAVSPDSRVVIVASDGDDAIVSFRRNRATGALTFADVEKDGVGLNGLDGAAALAFGPRGDTVYVAAAVDNAVTAFTVDVSVANLGLLGIIDVEIDGISGVDGLLGARGIAVSPDGRQLFAAGTGEGEIAIFNRVTTVGGSYGTLSFVEVADFPGVAGLTMSPGGEQLYATSPTGDALGIFNETAGASCGGGGGSGNISRAVTLPAHSALTFSAAATVSPTASGMLENTAMVTAPVGVVDATTPLPTGICIAAVDTSNNRCTDRDQIGLVADLVVTKTASTVSVVPGGGLGYTVTVVNDGPADVAGVIVTDPGLANPELTSVTWTCTPQAGALCGPSPGAGAISQTVTLPAGGRVRYDITATVAPSAVGVACTSIPGANCIVNTAQAALPSGYIDATPGDQSATVETPIGPQAELTITKELLTPTAGANDPLSYRIIVRNCGPSNVTNARVEDNFPIDYLTPTWSCSAVNGSCGTLNGSGDIDVLVTLQAGAANGCANAGVATFIVDGTVGPLAEGVLTNVAKVTPPSGVFDPTQGNNTASVNLVLSATADLAIIKDDGQTFAVPGSQITYSITVLNNGPDNATEVLVEDIFSPLLRDVRWTCDSDAPALGTLTYVEELRDGAVIEGEPFDGLAGARGVAIAPDGGHVYATGYGDDALVVLGRSAATGALTPIATIFEGDTQGPLTVAGLEGAAGVAVSPDGLNVYVAGATSNAVAVFKRNPFLGTLTFIQAVVDGAGGTVDGLAGARAVALSPDGNHVYVAGELDDAVAVFRRDASLEGTLEFKQVARDGVGPFDGLAAPSALVVSPDGAHLYVTSEGEDAITALRRETSGASPSFGQLSFVETLRDGDVQGSLTIDWLDAASGVGVSFDGRHVYVSAAGDHAVSVFARNTSSADVDFGRLGFLGARYESDSGPGGSVSGIEGASGVALAPDGQHVYVSGGAANAVVVFQRSTATGSLKVIEVRRDGVDMPCAPSGIACPVNSLEGPGPLVVAADGFHLYVAAAGDSAVTAFERAGPPPAFAFTGGQPLSSPPAPVRDGVGGVDGLDAVSAVAVTSDGMFAYSVGFADAAITAFGRDPVTGDLTQLAPPLRDGIGGVDGLEGASGIALVGNHVYVASQSVVEADNSVAVFSRHPSTGLLTFVQVLRQGQGGVTGIFGAAAIAADPSGEHLYVASRFPGAVAVFKRNSANGTLTFVEAKTVGVGGIVGLQGAHGVALSSDGAHVYVTASVDDAVVVFRRGTDGGDPATFGRLTQVQLVQALPGLDRALGITISPDPGDGLGSRNVYVTGHTSDALVVFTRNIDNTSPDFGKLSAVQTFVNGQGGVTGLDGARAVTVSPDGKNVYVAGEDSDALAVFAREATGGTLLFVEARVDGVDGVDGLDQAYAVAVSPTGRHVYVVGFGEDAIAVFSRVSGSRCTGSGVGNLIDTIDVAAGGQVVYTVTATIAPGATGVLVNEAYVTVPTGITDPGDDSDGLHPPGTCPGNSAPGYPALTDNNACRDIDVLTPRADLELIKTDRDDVAVPGEQLTYTITVINDGPSNVVGATVYDDLTNVFPAGASWTCVAAPSGALTFLAAYSDGDEQPQPAPDPPVTIEGLDGASSLAVSPDGVHLYATGLGDDSVTVFSIDATTGALAFLEAELDGAGGVDGLDGASAVVVSPDGEHVYVAGQIDDAVVVFTRQSNPLHAEFGRLTPLEVIQDAGHPAPIPGATLISGLDQPVGLAFDPAGDSLYVAAANSNSVTVLARGNDFPGNPAGFGRLTFLQRLQDGVGGIDGLAGASAVDVSSDGQHVYATGANDHALVAFTRAGDGTLSFVESKTDNAGGIDGLDTPRAVAVSADGVSVYVAGAGDNALAVFERAPASGTLTFRQVLRQGVGGVTGLAGAAAVAVSPDGFHVYAGAGAAAAVAVFRRDLETGGKLDFVEAQRDGLSGVKGLEGTGSVRLSPNGELVFAAGRVADSVAVFRRPVDSSCNGGSDFTGPAIELLDVVNIAARSRIVYSVTGVVDPNICQGNPCTGIQLVNHAEVTLPGGTTDPNLGDNSDTDTNALSPRVDLSITKTDGIAVVQGLAGAFGVAVSPDGQHLYAAGQSGDGVVVFAREAPDGALVFVESQLDNQDGVDGLNGASAAWISPDGAHVYVAGNSDNAVAVFARDAATGALAFLERKQSGVGGVTSMLGPWSLTGSADGRFLYVAASASSAIAIFAREPDSESPQFGRLSFLGAVADGANGVDGLGLVRQIVLSPVSLAAVNSHLYAVGESDSAIAAFARDESTGALTFLGVHSHGVAGVTGMAGARALDVSPDGRHLYVAARTADAVALFARESNSGSPNYGKLTFVGAVVDGDGGIDGLDGASAVAVAPDPPGGDPGGQHVYVAGLEDDAVAVFARDAVSGALTFVEVRRNGFDDISGLDGPSGLALSPDGQNLYAAAFHDGAVVAFTRDWDSGTETGTGDLTFVDVQSEGSGTVAPGTVIEYTITVTNHGPSAVRNARVTDIFPGQLEDVEWDCVTLTPGAQCFGGLSGLGDLNQLVFLPPGGSIEFLARGKIKSGVTGTITNTATITAPVGVIDLDPSNNSASDTNTVLGRVADLQVTKVACTDFGDCDGTLTGTAVPGTPVRYRVRVENLGPSDVQGAVLTDVLPEVLVDGFWSCAAAPIAGLLEPIEAQADGAALAVPVPKSCPVGAEFSAIDGLAGARAVALSPDGLSVYVAGKDDDALAVFRRDLRNGKLAFVELVQDGQPVYNGACAVTGSVDGLDQPSGVVVSPDGKHVYATGQADDAVVAFGRAASTGKLSFLQMLRDGVGGANGLGNARGLAISPNGAHVYTASPSDNGVGIFSRSSVTGLLTYLSIRVDGQSQGPLTLDGLAGAAAVAVSPAGDSVYVAGAAEAGIAVFSRDAGTGLLTFVEAEKNGVNGVSGLGGVSALAISADGRHLYAGGTADGAVVVFRRNVVTGGLDYKETHVDGIDGVDGLTGVAGLAVTLDGEHLYAAGAGDNAVAIFQRDPVSGKLAFLEAEFDGPGADEKLGGAAAIAPSADGDQIYVAAAAENAVAVLARGAGSRCTRSGYGDLRDGVDIVAGGSVTYDIEAVLAPSAVGTLTNVASVVSPAINDDPVAANDEAVLVLDITPVVNLVMEKTDGQTEAIPGLPLSYTITIQNNGPSDLVGGLIEDYFPPIFVDTEWSCVATAALSQIDLEVQGAGGVSGLSGPRTIVVAPDPDGVFGPEPGGEHVYVAARGSNSIAVFARDGGDGTLAFLTRYADGVDGIDGLGGAGGVALSPDGRHLYATGATDGALAVFERDPATGLLTLVEIELESDPGVDGLAGAVAVTVSRDGRNVYVVSEEDDALAVFARDPGTGELTFLERKKDGFGSLPLLVIDGATAVAVTPDGSQVLVAGAESDTLAVFDRDPDTGLVTYRTVFRDSVAGVDDLDLPQSIAVSPGGGYVYVAALADDAITIFSRDDATGELSYLGVVKNGVGGVQGLDGVRSLALSADGLYLAAVGYNDDALVLFRRDGFTGLLEPRAVLRDGIAGVDGLDGARGVTFSPTSAYIYTTGDHDNAAAAFARLGRASCGGPGTGDLIDTVDIAVGGSVVYTVNGFVVPSATGLLINTVTATMPPPTTNDGDDSATDIDVLTPIADLSITKSNFVNEVTPGTATVYLITVANAGPSDAPATLVSDPLPPGVLSATWSCEGVAGGVCAPTGSGPLAELVDLPVGSSVVFAFVAFIDPAATGTLVNVATVAPAAGVTDPNLANNTATDSDLLVPRADFSIDKTVDETLLSPGDPLVFTLVVSNAGPSQAAAQVVDLLPAGLTNVVITAVDWTCGQVGDVITCDIAAVAPGTQAPPIEIAADAQTLPGTYVNGAAVSTPAIDPISANDTDTASYTVGSGPQVVSVATVPISAGGTLEEMETAEVAVTALRVTFDEAVFDPPGDGDPDDVTNPENFQLYEAGPDGLFATTGCGLQAGDDRRIVTGPVSYDGGTFTATVAVGGGVPLHDGLYQLFVCGSTSIVDLDGTPLDGNGDGVPGDDYGLLFRTRHQNLVARSHFDFATDLDAWIPTVPVPGDVAWDPAEDSDGFPLSGSVHFTNVTGGTLLSLRQCLATVPTDTYQFQVDFLVDFPVGADVVARGAVESWASGVCGVGVASRSGGLTSGDTGGDWITQGLFVPLIGTGGGAVVSVVLEVQTLSGSPFDVRVDQVKLMATMFSDGFETGDTSRWSVTVSGP